MRECARSSWPRFALVAGASLFPVLAMAGNPPSAEGGPGPPELVHIEPGTPIGNRPPENWSHLIVKALPRLTSGDLDTLPESAFRTATLFRTVILADVGPATSPAGSFVLRRLGLGLCVPSPRGQDVLVRSGRLAESGVRLGLVEKVVLKSAEAELNQGKLVAATPTFALYRAPTVMRGQSQHQRVIFSYAFFVEPRRGGLRTFVWARDALSVKASATTEVVELKPNLVYDCRLSVEAGKVLGTVPVSWSFAMESLPPGEGRDVPTPLLDVPATAAEGVPQSRRLERHLRQALMATSSSGSNSTEP